MISFCGCISFNAFSNTDSDSIKVRPHAWNSNKIIISAGVGFPNYEKDDLLSNSASSSYTLTNVKGQGPFHAKLEYALGERTGLGLSVNYSDVGFTRYEPNNNIYNPSPYDTAIYKLSFFSLNLRANYHFLSDKMLDPYIGGGIGFKQFKIKYVNAGKNNFSGTAYVENFGLPFGVELTLGIRCFINKYLGAYLEAGISRSIVQGGLCFNVGRN